MVKYRNKIVILMLVLIVSLLVLFIGWFGKFNNNSDRVLEPSHKLKVLILNTTTATTREQFIEQLDSMYSESLKANFPEMEVEYINTDFTDVSSENYVELLGKELVDKNIDVIYISFDPSDRIYDSLIKDGYLQDLSIYPLEEFNLTSGTIQKLTNPINGNLYGLPMSLFTGSIIYNPELFKKYNIPFPVNYMTWEDVLKLAQQFPVTEVAGLSAPDPSTLSFKLARTDEISIVDEQNLKVTVNTPEWERNIEMVIKGYNDKYIASDIMNDLFMQGKSAMALMSYETLMSKIQTSSLDFEWAAVTQPVKDHETRDSSVYPVTDLWTIHQNSTNKDLAWRFIKYMNSQESLEKWHQTYPNKLLANTDVMQQYESDRVNSFYEQMPSDYKEPAVNPDKYSEILAVYESAFNDMKAGIVGIKEGLSNVESKGNQILRN